MQQKIHQALESGAFDQALQLAQAWAASEPHLADAHRALAHVLAQSGDAAAALVALDQAIALAPEEAALHHERALLLVREGDTAGAHAALGQSLGLDPNHLPAYLAQARLAIAMGRLDEAERLIRTAGRIDEGHPQLVALDGLLALRRGQHDRALALASAASKRLPDDPQVLSVMGFGYIAKGNWAFAEQSFRRVIGLVPDARGLQPLLAQVLAAQDRPAEAVEVVAPLLDDPATATPALLRAAGLYALHARRPEQARPWLARALEARPDDSIALRGLLTLWAATNARDDARDTLESLLAAHPDNGMAWAARLALEEPATAEASAVLQRWHAAMPGHVPALEAELFNSDRSGDAAATRAAAERLLQAVPGHPAARQFLIEAMLLEDPDAALAQARQVLEGAAEGAERDTVGSWIGRLLDRIGRHAEAVAQWQTLHDAHAATRTEPPALAALPQQWPPLATAEADAPQPLLVWGAPGSGVERVVDTLAAAGGPVLADRYGRNPPQDPLQSLATGLALLDGRLPPDALVAQWRHQLPARGIDNGNVVDWLLHWDNALLLALRPHLPAGRLLAVLRDPRDMLLDWMSYGAALPLKLASADAAAQWLAQVLEQLVVLQEQDLYPLTVLRLDEVINNPEALAGVVGQALGVALPPPRATPRRMPAGRWRAYADALAGPFATLTPVAVRLGYAEA